LTDRLGRGLFLALLVDGLGWRGVVLGGGDGLLFVCEAVTKVEFSRAGIPYEPPSIFFVDLTLRGSDGELLLLLAITPTLLLESDNSLAGSVSNMLAYRSLAGCGLRGSLTPCW
jgi:hypothetical protein